ncbi:MAG: metallophosphoesterase [Actinobacteria bacterium]|nr:metallophosphoesterase [Actinomycetota bacterium]
MIRLAHLSDMHLVDDPDGLVSGYDSTANLEAVIDAFAEPPDVAVVTGDITEAAEPGAYETARTTLRRLTGEVHYVPGNHDDPGAMRNILDAGHDLRMVELSPRWTMALVSSAWEGHGEGRVEPATLAQLADEVAAAGATNVLVCMHHPPLSTCDYAYCRIDNRAEVMTALTRMPGVRAVLSGHLHRRFDREHRGLRLLGAPSTCRQLKHRRTPGHFTSTQAPPAAALVELHDDGTIVNKTVVANRRQPGPYRRFLSQTLRPLASR